MNITHDAKIYIAGHQGLVGSSLIKSLQAHGYHNLITRTLAELDLRNQAATNDFFAHEKPDYVIIAAAKVGGIVANNTYRGEFIYDNLMIASNIIHAAYRYNVKKLINLGSSCIYPKNAPQPLQESYLLSSPLEPTNEPYAIAKIAAIKLCNAYNDQYGTNFISVMPTNMYGPHDNYNLETAHVLPALIRKFHLAKLLQQERWTDIQADIQRFPLSTKKTAATLYPATPITIQAELATFGITASTVTLWGTGTPRREFMFVDDLGAALVFLLQNSINLQPHGFVNIGTGTDVTINELASLIKRIVGFEGTITYDASKPDGTSQKLLDVSWMHNLGWKARVTLEDGIFQTYHNTYCATQKEKNIAKEYHESF